MASASSLRDAIEEKLSREKTLAGSVGKLFEYVPAHLVPIDEHVVKAGVILDRLCFNMLAQRLLNATLARRATDALFDELDADATGFLSLLEIVRRIQKVNALPSTNFVDAPKGPSRPKVTAAEVDAVQAALVGKLEGMVRQDTKLLSTIVMFFEKASHAGEVTHKRGKMRVLSQAEFHHLLVRMLHIPVSREVSDGLFARILGMPIGTAWAGGEMSVNAFIGKIMPPDYGAETWHAVRSTEMARMEAIRQNPRDQFNRHVPSPAKARTKIDPKQLRLRIGDQLARLTSADSHILQTMVKIFSSANDPPGRRTSHLGGSGASTPVWKSKCSGYVQHGPIRTDSARGIGQTSRSRVEMITGPRMSRKDLVLSEIDEFQGCLGRPKPVVVFHTGRRPRRRCRRSTRCSATWTTTTTTRACRRRCSSRGSRRAAARSRRSASSPSRTRRRVRAATTPRANRRRRRRRRGRRSRPSPSRRGRRRRRHP